MLPVEATVKYLALLYRHDLSAYKVIKHFEIDNFSNFVLHYDKTLISFMYCFTSQ
ncbi:hypothetical protein Phi40:1_gp057 [Cellulophaga phage phi40:1]|uniref:Uncharacterized protein n=1 Tax=Cellulophaga phage phi38:1 TaxID=1327977 RepID=S0A0S5_9CAUD|nr:hypothetical protein Phi38:1_gp057 [Cellulophaga phage phi38:1]AGO47922.1 hypothetical protein Phi40:1_gp057 [Cellulophaga phage phi40:1]AGO48087.1 hypothetical protein Phi38:1_gp057 [Cellulophaga phage phi38:1]